MSLSDLRRDYSLQGLSRSDLNPDPIVQFDKWFQEAVDAKVLEPNAMTLSTVDMEGHPSSRIVLLKGVDARGFVFFTNYESRKGRELQTNPNAAINFHWPLLERQICIRGKTSRMSVEESTVYFHSRPRLSQISAWTSQQSSVVENRTALEKNWQEQMDKWKEGEIPLPPFWGGFLLDPESIEFWQGRPNRLHDRFLYSRQTDGAWHIDRLSP